MAIQITSMTIIPQAIMATGHLSSRLKGRRIEAQYSFGTTIPSIANLVPTVNSSDPLNLRFSNPQLNAIILIEQTPWQRQGVFVLTISEYHAKSPTKLYKKNRKM